MNDSTRSGRAPAAPGAGRSSAGNDAGSTRAAGAASRPACAAAAAPAAARRTAAAMTDVLKEHLPARPWFRVGARGEKYRRRRGARREGEGAPKCVGRRPGRKRRRPGRIGRRTPPRIRRGRRGAAPGWAESWASRRVPRSSTGCAGSPADAATCCAERCPDEPDGADARRVRRSARGRPPRRGEGRRIHERRRRCRPDRRGRGRMDQRERRGERGPRPPAPAPARDAPDPTPDPRRAGRPPARRSNFTGAADAPTRPKPGGFLRPTPSAAEAPYRQRRARQVVETLLHCTRHNNRGLGPASGLPLNTRPIRGTGGNPTVPVCAVVVATGPATIQVAGHLRMKGAVAMRPTAAALSPSASPGPAPPASPRAAAAPPGSARESERAGEAPASLGRPVRSHGDRVDRGRLARPAVPGDPGRRDEPAGSEGAVVVTLDPEGRGFRYILLARKRAGTMRRESNEAPPGRNSTRRTAFSTRVGGHPRSRSQRPRIPHAAPKACMRANDRPRIAASGYAAHERRTPTSRGRRQDGDRRAGTVPPAGKP